MPLPLPLPDGGGRWPHTPVSLTLHMLMPHPLSGQAACRTGLPALAQLYSCTRAVL